MNEQAILNTVLSQLKNNTGIHADIKHSESADDGAIILLSKNNQDQQFLSVIKNQPTITMLGMIISEHECSTPLLLIANYITPAAASLLKERQCNFIDSTGNAFISFGPIYVDISGKKPSKPIFKKTHTSRAFTSTGLKLLFTFICYPGDALNLNYRTLSKIAGVSIGAIGFIINDLKEQGYLILDSHQQRKLINKQELIKQWVTAYPEKLRPKLILGYYYALQNNWWENININNFKACWSGELAADKLTRYLKPEFITLYSDDTLGKLVLMNGLQEAKLMELATVEILEQFWNFDNAANPELAPALLIYADLIASGHSRSLDTAKLVYEQFINEII